MRDYRLSYYGLRGFDIKDFDTKDEALKFVNRETRMGLITPEKLYKYNGTKDQYEQIGYFSKKEMGA